MAAQKGSGTSVKINTFAEQTTNRVIGCFVLYLPYKEKESLTCCFCDRAPNNVMICWDALKQTTKWMFLVITKKNSNLWRWVSRTKTSNHFLYKAVLWAGYDSFLGLLFLQSFSAKTKCKFEFPDYSSCGLIMSKLNKTCFQSHKRRFLFSNSTSELSRKIEFRY